MVFDERGVFWESAHMRTDNTQHDWGRITDFMCSYVYVHMYRTPGPIYYTLSAVGGRAQPLMQYIYILTLLCERNVWSVRVASDRSLQMCTPVPPQRWRSPRCRRCCENMLNLQ